MAAKMITAGSIEHIKTMTAEQLRALAASTDPNHIVAGFAAECELVMRGTCQDSGAQVLTAVSNGTAWCGSCGQTVAVVTRPADSNEIPHYGTHGA